MANTLKRREWDQEIAGLRERLRELTRLTDADRGARIQSAAAGFQFFCHTYFPHLISDHTNAFHAWLYPAACTWGPGSRVVIAAPRGNAKTTMISRLYVLWRVVRGDVRNVIIISDSIDQSKRSLEAVSAELEENPRLLDDFPSACGKGRIWQAVSVVTANSVMISCAGAGKRIRGLNFRGARPDMIVLDDLENDENVRTPEQRAKLEHWFGHTVMHLGPPDGSAQMLYIGTWLHYDGLMARIIRRGDFEYHKFKALLQYPANMDLWQTWEKTWRVDRQQARQYYAGRRSDMDAGAVVLWPGVQPLYALMEARASDRKAFAAELQNEPLDEASRIFRPEAFAYWDALPDKLLFYGACDPAMGKSRGDYCALVVVGRDVLTGKVYVVDARIDRIMPQRAIDEIVRMQREWRCVRWVVEEVAFQEFFRQVLVSESLKAMSPVPAVGIKPRASKDIRIESLSPHIENGTILFSREHVLLLDQLGYYPLADHDDGPDALEMAWSCAYASGAKIETRRISGGRMRGF